MKSGIKHILMFGIAKNNFKTEHPEEWSRINPSRVYPEYGMIPTGDCSSQTIFFITSNC